MTPADLSAAKADIESTDDLLVRAMKLAGLPDFKVLEGLRRLRQEVSRYAPGVWRRTGARLWF